MMQGFDNIYILAISFHDQGHNKNRVKDWERDAAIPYNSDKRVVRGLKGKILEFSSIVRKQNGRQASSQSPHLEAEYQQNAIASGNLPAQANR